MKDNIFFKILDFAAKSNTYFTVYDLASVMKDAHEAPLFYENMIRMSSVKQERNSQTFLIGRTKIERNGVPEYLSRALTHSEEQDSEVNLIHVEFIIAPVGMATYLEMLELHESRKAAKQAKNISWFAIIVTLLIGVGQLFLASLQTTDTLIISFIRSLFQ